MNKKKTQKTSHEPGGETMSNERKKMIGRKIVRSPKIEKEEAKLVFISFFLSYFIVMFHSFTMGNIISHEKRKEKQKKITKMPFENTCWCAWWYSFGYVQKAYVRWNSGPNMYERWKMKTGPHTKYLENISISIFHHIKKIWMCVYTC